MTHLVSMLIYPGVQILDVTGPLEVFARTARWLSDHDVCLNEPAYKVELLADSVGPVASSSGIELVTHRSWHDVTGTDTLLVAGGIGYSDAMTDRGMIRWLKQMHTTVGRMGSVCTGAMLLAEAGLLDNHRATTHWAYGSRLANTGHNIELEPDAIYVLDDGLYTSAGVTAGMDMALAMVESDWDTDVALAVARELVLFLKRPGGQAQFSRQLEAQQAESSKLRKLQLWMLEHLGEDLSVTALAQRVAMSPRNFARRFSEELGDTPAAYVSQIRMEAARHKLETTALPISQIAKICGFGASESMRRIFSQKLGVSPRQYRARFSSAC